MMIKTYLFIGSIICLLVFSSCQEKRAVDYVDPFICSQGDHGHWLPAALVPFGMVGVCPDTYPGSLTADGDFAHSGYDFSDNQVRGFSNFHKGSSGGTAVTDRAGLLSLLPFINVPDSFYFSPIVNIDKKTEKASPGYYSVFLPDDQIKAELTAETHVGVHRYSYPSGPPVRLFLYEGNRSRSGGITFSMKDSQCIEGIQYSYGGIYFTMKFSAPVISSKTWNGTALAEGASLEKQHAGGMVLDFGDLKGKPLEVRVGVSLTSIAAAHKNLKAECPDEISFEQIQSNALETWNHTLSGIEVSGEDEYKTIFYTALYHSCFLPQVISDVDGTYPGLDQKNHIAKGYQHYNNYAFWDDFRTKFPLYSLWQPRVYRDIVKSIRDLYEEAQSWGITEDSDHAAHGSVGFRPEGIGGYQVFNTCRHEHMLMVMADAYTKGIFPLDLKSVYPYMRHEAMIQMPERYDSIGFIPARPDQTGEFCWDSWCMAQLARATGNDADYNYFTKRADYWKNTWDPSIRYFRAREADGTWLDFPDDPAINREKYTYEGSKWQWRWNVIHDVPGLIGAFGGKDAFAKELEYFFNNDLYTAGNQIDLQAPFLFNYAGKPWLTQEWSTKILTQPITQRYGTHDFFPEPVFDRIYKTTPDGYLEEMDCDYGCMAAWYNMSAMGLYQMCPGDPVYQLTSPIFESIKIKLNDPTYPGKEFVIEAKGLSDTNIYIQSATLNGKPYNRSSLTHEEIARGGKLVYQMGPEPNMRWGMN
ncbi:glycoside hydrolase family 92 protein [Maribellus luteus]|uniref:Glycoside hydrolase family 92 protein n=1 Tax=Maribellus luteus TaxID=2305463 RepID=A0A399T1L0_9BACT|nr:GH92 family glycosyl hydrolase [Maribellus luteus]RIJ48021.1 glycoside hydrolase family 92 protein [Maribellus luteus]